MKTRRLFACLCLLALSVGAALPALALTNRVFVSARSGNNLNACDNINTPCQTLAGAVTQLNANGEVIILDSGGYGAVTITTGVTIEAPAGVTAFIHPALGDAITVNAGLTDRVTLRGLTINGGTVNGITVNSVGTLNVVNCFITGFADVGLAMLSPGHLNVKGTDIKDCFGGVVLANTTGVVRASIDHCHLSGNFVGFAAGTTSPGSSSTTATYTTANNNGAGWLCGSVATGSDTLNLEFCTGSENNANGLIINSAGLVRYSSCVFANNGSFGVVNQGPGTVETRGSNTITGNGITPTSGAIASYLPL